MTKTREPHVTRLGVSLSGKMTRSKKYPRPLIKEDRAGREWTAYEFSLAMDPSVPTEVLMEVTGRTRSAVNRKRWEWKRTQAHHPIGAPCHCFCFRKNGWHCEGGKEHVAFIRKHSDNRQRSLFKV